MSSDCAFCPKPDKLTRWYEESDRAIVMNNFHGEPMVVLKRHTETPTDEELQHCRELVSNHFSDDCEFRVLMNIVEEHWHAHIVEESSKTLVHE